MKALYLTLTTIVIAMALTSAPIKAQSSAEDRTPAVIVTTSGISTAYYMADNGDDYPYAMDCMFAVPFPDGIKTGYIVNGINDPIARTWPTTLIIGDDSRTNDAYDAVYYCDDTANQLEDVVSFTPRRLTTQEQNYGRDTGYTINVYTLSFYDDYIDSIRLVFTQETLGKTYALWYNPTSGKVGYRAVIPVQAPTPKVYAPIVSK